MQKLIVIALLAAAIFPSCKKDKTAPAIKSVNELIKGIWTTADEKYEYYNADNVNKLLATETLAPGDFKYTITDKLTKTKLKTNEMEVSNTDYVIIQKDGKNYISFKAKDKHQHDNVYNNQEFEIVYLTDKAMQWRQVKNVPEYIDHGVTQQAAKVIIITLTFKKTDVLRR